MSEASELWPFHFPDTWAGRSVPEPPVRLLQVTPRPDDAYFDAVEEIARNQPALPETPWER